jgi:hypothetical protein
LLEFIYEKNHIGFPRCCRIPRKGSTKIKEDIVTQILQRTTPGKLYYNDLIIGDKMVEDVPFHKIVLNCQKKLKLLTYIDS